MKFYCEIYGHIWIFGSLSSLQKMMNLAISLQMSILTFSPWIVEFKRITSWQIDGETVETVADFIFLGSKITADGDCSHEIKRRLLLGRKVMTNLAAAAAESLQSCPTLCDHIEGSPPGSPVPGILQARTLEWVAISFSNAWKWKVKVKSLSRVRL